ncbi:MAG: 16S rRNA (cytosine(967)-C(5))-methyltransferase RsmB [Candidatus Cloacimonetes bacterium]|nr:16S rRNA (cytosine(967)-C(5))-methyltransferase RsmB [Candidatus Cloacimonadota bacterium]
MLRNEAYQVINKVFKDQEFSDTLLQQRAKRIVAAKQNLGLFYNLVKGSIKMKGQLDYIASLHTDPKKYETTDLKIKVLLYIGLYQLIYLDSIPQHAAINETVELAKKLFNPAVGDFINAVLRSWQRNPQITWPEDPIQRAAAEHSYPPEIVSRWFELWGEEDAEYLMLYFNENPLLHLRVNSTATTMEKLIQYFAKREISLTSTGYGKCMLSTDKADQVLEDVAFSEGYFSVQDSSAAMVIDLLDPQKEESILDFFAAPGGKCTYISEKMDNTGEVIAVDKSPAKIKLLKRAADRLQLFNIKLVTSDVFKYGPVAPAYNRVLVDAPCSGWGVFGRKADLRWHSFQNIPDLLKLQEKALDTAAKFVRPEGYLVYSTCTMNPDENQEQIKSFLERNKNFQLVAPGKLIPADCIKDGMMRTIPFKHHIDGAFAAKMQKIK